MNKKSDIVDFICFCFIVLVVFLVWSWFQTYACHSKWNRVVSEVEWGPIQGCMLKKEDGKWIPAENYRDLAE